MHKCCKLFIAWDQNNSPIYFALPNIATDNIEEILKSVAIDEFSEVLKRDFEYNEEEINDIIETVLAFVRLAEPKEKLDIIKEDPDDNKILECAIASRSEYILTYDNHLLNLNEFRGVRIVKPEEILVKWI